VTSKGFISTIINRSIVSNKIEYFPQWAEKMFKPIDSPKYLLGDIPKDSFKIMFAGNIGEAQDFPSILETARLLKRYKNIQWIILGNGRKAEWANNKINEYGLKDCFHLFGSYPLEKMPEFYANADAMLLSLKNEYIFSITVPAKVQSYLACGKPILAMINGEAADMINTAKAGLTCTSGDSVTLSKNILKMSNMTPTQLKQLSNNSFKYYNEYFNRELLFKRAEDILLEMVKKGHNYL
jgi:glycosyltransferase involved in cell wall biosynthesis